MSTICCYGQVMADVNWLDEREQRAWRALQNMQMKIDGELGRRLAAATDLSNADYAVLVVLTEQPEGRMRLFELGAEIGWEKSRLSHQVSRMATRGLVCKEKCPSDKRGAFVVLTADGRRAIEAAAPGHVADVRELFIDHLAPEQLDALAEIAETVLAAVADRVG